MNTPLATLQLPPELQNLVMLATLMERVEHSLQPFHPEQYRVVVQRLSQALQDATPGPALSAVLAAHPVAAQVYENLHYAHAGLCLAPLDVAAQTELQAREAIARASGWPAAARG